MLADVRRYVAPELDAEQAVADVRVGCLRASFYQGRNVVSDYGLLQRAVPFLHRLRRPQLSILLEGQGRFEEGGQRRFLRAGELVVSDSRQQGTEAYAGARCRWLVITWDPSLLGAPVGGPFEIVRLGAREVGRLCRAAPRLAGASPLEAMADVLAILRGVGLRFEHVSAADLGAHAPGADFAQLQAAIAANLARLERHPSSDELAASLGWHERRLRRRFAAMADEYQLPWSHWREALYQTRLLQATRLLSAPGATTELVARRTGFRAPTALCHAFAKAGLPSPGALAREARRDPLDRWASFVPLRSKAVDG